MSHIFSSHIPLFVVLTLYTFVIYLLVFFASKHTKKVADYVLGGRHLSGFVTALSAGASDMSSWLLMALPGMVLVEGMGMVWLPLSLTAGAYVNWLVVAKRLRIYTAMAGDALTIPAYLSRRFGGSDRRLRLLSSMTIMFFFCFYAVAGFVSAAKLTELTFGIDYHYALWGSGFFIVAYTAFGGFLAVSWVDVFQGILMFFALLIVPLVVYGQLDDFAEGVQQLGTTHPRYWDITQGVSVLGIISLFAWGMGYVGQPHIIGRFMAIRSAQELPFARRVCTVWMALAMMFAFGVGLVGAVYYRNTPLHDPETVFLALSQRFFNDWLNGILLCAVLSSIMSTVSCLILMAANALVEDFYHVIFPQKKGTQAGNLTWHRMAVWVVSFVSLGIASSPSLTIMQSVAFPWCGLGASLGPVIVMSLYWKRMTKEGTMAGIISGGGFVVIWEVMSRMGNAYVNHPSLLVGFCLLPGFLISLIAIVVVSYRTPAPTDKVVEQFEDVVRKVLE